jgi:hypothetical protein
MVAGNLERAVLDVFCIGTSATMTSEGTGADRTTAVATIATQLCGVQVRSTNVMTATLERVTRDSVPTHFLLLAYATRSPSTGRSLFAFRLHQCIAGAGDFCGTLEPPGWWYLTVSAWEGR